MVTPCAGVWIEIRISNWTAGRCLVTPCAGVWIEIRTLIAGRKGKSVTPCAGVWIEIKCCLKRTLKRLCHSLCGSVD